MSRLLLQQYGFILAKRNKAKLPPGLEERMAPYRGKWIVFDGWDDADGFCVVGDDADVLVAETLEHIDFLECGNKSAVELPKASARFYAEMLEMIALGCFQHRGFAFDMFQARCRRLVPSGENLHEFAYIGTADELEPAAAEAAARIVEGL